MRLTDGLRFLAVLLLLQACSSAARVAIPVANENYPADLPVITRAQWGWQPLQRSVPKHEISRVTIHHGGVEVGPEKDTIAYLKNLQNWSRSEKQWIDMPYHYMIDLQGKIYEGRPLAYPGDTNTGYDPRGHALICVIGNYEVQSISPAQIDALARLAAWLIARYELGLDTLAGHRDYAPGETVCPGENLYRLLQDGSLRRQVAVYLGK